MHTSAFPFKERIFHSYKLTVAINSSRNSDRFFLSWRSGPNQMLSILNWIGTEGTFAVFQWNEISIKTRINGNLKMQYLEMNENLPTKLWKILPGEKKNTKNIMPYLQIPLVSLQLVWLQRVLTRIICFLFWRKLRVEGLHPASSPLDKNWPGVVSADLFCLFCDLLHFISL